MKMSRRSGPIEEEQVLRGDHSYCVKSIDEIKKRDVSDLVSLIAQRNADMPATVSPSSIKDVLRWCVGRGHRLLAAEGISSATGTSIGIACEPIR